jgi:hypothetical protein
LADRRINPPATRWKDRFGPVFGEDDKNSQGRLTPCSRDVYVPVEDEDLINFEKEELQGRNHLTNRDFIGAI